MSGNFVIYLIGYIIVIIGVAYGMSAAGLGQQWIIPAVLILAGLGIVYALSRSQRDVASKPSSQGSQHTTNVQSPPQNQGQGTSSGEGQTSTGGKGETSSGGPGQSGSTRS